MQYWWFGAAALRAGATARCVGGCRRAVFVGIEPRLETLNRGGAVLQDAARPEWSEAGPTGRLDAGQGSGRERGLA